MSGYPQTADIESAGIYKYTPWLIAAHHRAFVVLRIIVSGAKVVWATPAAAGILMRHADKYVRTTKA
jgi:hypothetical protein